MIAIIVLQEGTPEDIKHQNTDARLIAARERGQGVAGLGRAEIQNPMKPNENEPSLTEALSRINWRGNHGNKLYIIGHFDSDLEWLGGFTASEMSRILGTWPGIDAVSEIVLVACQAAGIGGGRGDVVLRSDTFASQLHSLLGMNFTKFVTVMAFTCFVSVNQAEEGAMFMLRFREDDKHVQNLADSIVQFSWNNRGIQERRYRQ